MTWCWRQQMTDADATRADVEQMTSRVTSAWTLDGACCAWCVDTENSGSAWGRVAAPMRAGLSLTGRSFQDDLNDTTRNLIGAIITAEWHVQWSMLCWTPQRQRLQVWNPKTTMEYVGSSTARGYSDCCDGRSDVESGVIPIKTRLLRKKKKKSQSNGSDTILEILEDCILFFNERIYIHQCLI